MSELEQPSWRQIRAVLDQVLKLAPRERQTAAAAVCGEDEALRLKVLSVLDAYAQGTEGSELPALDGGLVEGSDECDREIGVYRLVERIGEGGMGAVYLARRSDEAFTRQVAIKLLRRRWASSEELRRFRSERQILADLEHPSIARLLDGGETPEGRPYLVMEHVEGEKIDAWCRRRSLGLEQVIEIFLQVCGAVQFAHQRLIVHRDLKPSNILVTEKGEVKLLDFGIAKILNPEGFSATVMTTGEGLTPMTPGYASPEQVRGQAITTATDVYSLGLLFYLLLTGDLPYQVETGDLSSLVEVVCHREVPAPSSRIVASPSVGPARRRVRGDLDAIVLKALAKEPQHRYASAEQLADDLRRFLAHRPVRARTATFFYRSGKFLHRYRLGLSAASVVFLVLTASLLFSLEQQDRLVAERNRALHEQQIATSVTSFLVELFELPEPGRSLGESVTARSLLDKASSAIHHDLSEQPELQAELLGVLGRTYGRLGLLPEAGDLTQAALDLTRDRLVPEKLSSIQATSDADDSLVSLLLQQADIASQRGRFSEALELAREAERRTRGKADADPSTIARCQVEQGFCLSQLGRYREAEELFEQAIDGARAAGRRETLALGLEQLAELKVQLGESEGALELYREARGLRTELENPDHPDVAFLESAIAAIEARRRISALGGEAEDASKLLRHAVERQRALYDGDHPVLATSLNNLALISLDQGDIEEAEALFGESLEMKRRIFGPSHPKIAATLANLGLLEIRRQRFEEAEELYGLALEVFDREVGPSHPDHALCLANLGRVQIALGRSEIAQSSLEQALSRLEEALGPHHGRALAVRNNLGELMRRQARPEQAREHFLLAVQGAEGPPGGPASPLLTSLLFNLATVEAELGDRETATTRYRRIARLAGEDLIGLFALTRLARLQVEAGQWAEAEASAERAEQGLEGEPSQARWFFSARRARARAILEQGRIEEAVELFRHRLAHVAEHDPPGSKALRSAEEDLAEALARAEKRTGDRDGEA